MIVIHNSNNINQTSMSGSSGRIITCNGAATRGSGARMGQRRCGSNARRQSRGERVRRGGGEGLGRDAAEVGVEELRVLAAEQRRLPLLQPAQVLRFHHHPVLPARRHRPRRPHGSRHPARKNYGYLFLLHAFAARKQGASCRQAAIKGCYKPTP